MFNKLYLCIFEIYYNTFLILKLVRVFYIKKYP